MKSITFIISLILLFMNPALQAESYDLYDKVFECQNNPQGWPGLHWAIDQMHDESLALKFLDLYPEQRWWRAVTRVASSPSLEKGSLNGESALELAIKNGFPDLARELIARGANVNETRQIRYLKPHYYREDKSPLAYAIELQNKEMIALVLESGASIKQVYTHTAEYAYPGLNHTALMHALEYFPDDEVLRLLIIRGMEIRNKTPQDVTDEDLELFKKYTSDPTKLSGPWPALHHAFYMRDHIAAKRLFDLGESPDRCLYPKPREADFLAQTFSDRDRPPELVDIAISYDDQDLLFLLLEENISSERVLLHAIEADQQDVLQYALYLGVKSGKAVHQVLTSGKKETLILKSDQIPHNSHR